MTRGGAVVAACAVVLSMRAQPATAQTANVVSEQVVPSVPGLRLLTVQSGPAQCHAVFVLNAEPPRAADPDQPGAETTDAINSAVRRIRDAAEARDRQLADLRARLGIGVTTGGQLGQIDGGRQVAYELERLKIEAEYDRVLRAEIPGSAPWASMVAGSRSGGFEDAANAVRRALIDADPTSGMKTLSDRLTRIEGLLTDLITAPRLAVSGLVPCPGGR